MREQNKIHETERKKLPIEIVYNIYTTYIFSSIK